MQALAHIQEPVPQPLSLNHHKCPKNSVCSLKTLSDLCRNLFHALIKPHYVSNKLFIPFWCVASSVSTSKPHFGCKVQPVYAHKGNLHCIYLILTSPKYHYNNLLTRQS